MGAVRRGERPRACRTSTAPALLTLAALKLLVSGLMIAGGVTAISDDDFARVTIAQGFALEPSLDPSGTSWLPLPFWLYGTPMLLLGRSWEVARGVALVLGVLSVWAVWVTARLLGASRGGALLGAGLAALFPYSAWLGVATVPELPTAAAILLALACSSRSASLLQTAEPDARSRACALAGLGGLAITFACASRYEAWPVALGLAAVTLRDATTLAAANRRLALQLSVGVLALCVAFPAAWLLHGLARHDDALFFVRRVTDYKQALGTAPMGYVDILLAYPRAFVQAEPELLGITIGLVGLAGTRLLWRRAALLLGIQLVALIAGDLRGGGPTHHPERALLTGWLLAAVLAGDALFHLVARLRSRPGALRAALAAGMLVALGVGGYGGLRRDDLHLENFARRRAELAIGELAQKTLSPHETLLVATEDYGYFAVLAAFGAPERAQVLDRHDPREGATTAPPLERIRALAASQKGLWAVLPRSWPRPDNAREVTANPKLSLVHLPGPAAPQSPRDENSPRQAELH